MSERERERVCVCVCMCVRVGKSWLGALSASNFYPEATTPRAKNFVICLAKLSPIPSPRGSKYPIFRDSGPKSHSGYGCWNQGP